MSGPAVARVRAAHPLAPEHRMVLLEVAWAVPEGRTEVAINRAALARTLDTTPGLVTRALVAGETVGLCKVLRNGLVAFSGYDGLLGADPPAPTAPITKTLPDAAPVPARPSISEVFTAFKEAWERQYRTVYSFVPGKDAKLAKGLAVTLPLSELRRRIAIYLTSDDPFYVEKRHEFEWLARHVNQFIVESRPPAVPRGPAPDADSTAAYLKRQRGEQGDGRATQHVRGGPQK